MKKYYSIFPLAMAAFLAVAPQLALAHGHTAFKINGKVYSFIVGSLNEPIAVDDKTGLDLRVESMGYHAHEEANASGGEHLGTPVVGLEKTLKVELAAGDKKKTLDLTPAYGAPGAYKAYFIPTIQTTFGYRLFGTIDGVSFDYTFTCNPAGHPATPEDKTEVEVSKGVVRIEKSGAFGCPASKAELGFPEPVETEYDIAQAVMEINSTAKNARNSGIMGIIIGVLGLAAGGGALIKIKQRI